MAPKLDKQPTEFLYKIGYSLGFSHSISFSQFVITSAKIKKTVSAETGKVIYYHLYGIELDKSIHGKNLDKRGNSFKIPTLEDTELKCFATYGTGTHKFIAKTPEYATILMLNNLRNRKHI